MPYPNCSACGQDAPVVFRNGGSYCSACGAPAVPAVHRSLNVAGRPSKLGGEVAKGLGWAVLILGLLAAAVMGLFFAWLFPATQVPFIVGGAIGLLAIGLASSLLVGGGKLKAHGEATEKSVRQQALRAFAMQSGGVLTAQRVAAAHKMSEADADALLTEMARDGHGVTVDVSDAGEVLYRFESASLLGVPRVQSRQRVGQPGSADADLLDEAELDAATAARSRGMTR